VIGSSSAIVTAALLGAPTVYAVPAVSVTTTVSLGSTAVLLVGFTVMTALDAPAGITTVRESAA
jgi:hypothetical protein